MMPTAPQGVEEDAPGRMLGTYLHSYVEDLRSTLQEIDRSVLAAVVDVLIRARHEQRQIFIVGNGGSAATASHMACDLGKGTVDRANPGFRRFRAVSLADNTALITALGNDLSFDDIFAEQLATVMEDGDVVVAISASGNSPNLVRAVEYAKSRGGITIGLLGFGGGRLGELVDHALVVSSRNYGLSEDFHLIVQHVLTQYLRRELAGPARPVAFLDRDGVINQRLGPHEYVHRWDQFRFVDGAIPMLRELSDRGYALVVITNQQGIGKGVMTTSALHRIHDEMKRALSREGVSLAGVLHCPHLEHERCGCRKPQPGLIYRAMNESSFLMDLRKSILIGDSVTDTQAGHAAGVGTLVHVGGAQVDVPVGTIVVDSVRDVLDAIPHAPSQVTRSNGSGPTSLRAHQTVPNGATRTAIGTTKGLARSGR
jgi:D-sedoheptulose 7-phosphate isomerase